MAKGMGLWAWALALGVGGPAGCGSSGASPPPNCAQVQPCGGDLVGTWNLLGGCANVAQETTELQTSCPGAAVHAFGMTMAGSITFNADLTFTSSTWTETFAASETIPLSCVSASSCAALSAQSTISSPTSTTRVSCSGTSSCNCVVSSYDTLPADSGVYTVTNASLLVAGAQTGTSSQYCVEGPRLHMMQISSTRVGSNLEAIVLSDMVAERQ